MPMEDGMLGKMAARARQRFAAPNAANFAMLGAEKGAELSLVD